MHSRFVIRLINFAIIADANGCIVQGAINALPVSVNTAVPKRRDDFRRGSYL